MSIIRYAMAQVDATAGAAPGIGCPVRVYFAGQFQNVVYQFPGGGQREAVVDFASGAIIAPVYDWMAENSPHPQIRAQEAVDYAFGNMLPGPIRDKLRRAPPRNRGTPDRVGTFDRPPSDERH